MEQNTLQERARLFKALMHPARLAILEMLRGGEECVCHMEATLGYRQAYVSQHLAVLREAGLVRDRREGWMVYYRVVRPEVFGLLDTAARMLGQTEAAPAQPVVAASCPCPKCARQGEKVAV